MDILLLVGLILLVGQAGANLLRMIKVPQVVGYILVGVLLGRSVFHLIDPTRLAAVTGVALGLIGFTIGSQLNFKQLRKMGKSILWIAFLEAFGAFVLVGLSVWALTGKIYEGLVFGALASATAPAATVDVLQEYRCKGVLTMTILAVVGIDDGIALLIYSFAEPFAKSLFSPEAGISIMQLVVEPLKELGGSIVIGGLLGLVITWGLKYLIMPGEKLSGTLAVVFIASGIANQLHLSLILTTMVMGLVLGNLLPTKAPRLNDVVAGFAPPIYVLFFGLVGSRLDLKLLPAMGAIGIIYIVARAAGKFGGAYLGAKIGNATANVRKYLGLALFSQAGAAIGLAIAASNDFANAGPEGAAFGLRVLNIITATTFVVQIIGPTLTKIAVFKAGEARLPR